MHEDKGSKSTVESEVADLLNRQLPVHPFKRDILARGRDGNSVSVDLGVIAEQSRSCPSNIYIRVGEENEIFRKLNEGHSLILRGIWRMGKTEMLATMFSRKQLLPDCLPINFEVQPSSGLLRVEAVEFRKQLAHAQVIEHLAQRETLDDDNSEQVNFAQLITEVTERVNRAVSEGSSPLEYLNGILKQRGERVYVVFDEMITLCHEPEFIAELAKVAKLSQIYPIYVLQKHRSNDRRCLDVLGEIDQHCISPLNLQDIDQVANAFFSGTPYRMDDSAVMEIQRWSGGRPFEVNAMTHLIIDSFSQGLISGPIIDASGVNQMMEQNLANLANDSHHLLSPAVVNYIKVLSIGLSEDELAALDRIAKNESHELHDFKPEVIKELLRFHLITKCDSSTNAPRFKIQGDLFCHVICNRKAFQSFDYWAPDEYGGDYI